MNRAVATSAPRIKGNVTRQNARIEDRPYTTAASSISRGISSIKLRIIHMLRGNVNAVYARTSPTYVPVKCRNEYMTSMGTATAIGGNMRTVNTNIG